MARDHARIHLDIWGDDDFLDLPVDAQMLYFTLYTSEGRTLCGAHQWSAKKLTQRAGDWTVDRIEAAAQILSERLFLIIDADTDECLLRSWIKHDGLWRTPNMAVSVANARGNVASRTLRGGSRQAMRFVSGWTDLARRGASRNGRPAQGSSRSCSKTTRWSSSTSRLAF